MGTIGGVFVNALPICVISIFFLALNSVSTFSKHLFKTIEYLIGKTIDSYTIHEAVTVMQSEISFISFMRGTYEIDAVKIFHDFGKLKSIGIDTGQLEGALAQGIG
jgi:hypothetical protein